MSDNPLYDLIRQGQSGSEGYNAFNRGTYKVVVGGKKHDVSNPIGSVRHEPITTSTLEEIQTRQNFSAKDPRKLGAVGEYQTIQKTLREAADALEIHSDARLVEGLQDRIFSEGLLKHMPAVAGYIEGKPDVTLQAAQLRLARQWASFSDPIKGDLTSHYEGPANHASVSLAASAQALDTLRTRYADAHRAAVAGHDGDPASTAWTAATAIQPEQRARWERIQGPAAKPGDVGPAVAELRAS